MACGRTGRVEAGKREIKRQLQRKRQIKQCIEK